MNNCHPRFSRFMWLLRSISSLTLSLLNASESTMRFVAGATSSVLLCLYYITPLISSLNSVGFIFQLLFSTMSKQLHYFVGMPESYRQFDDTYPPERSHRPPTDALKKRD